MKHILVVDDDRQVVELLRAGLEGVGLRATSAPDFGAATRLLDRGNFDLLITDLDLPGGNGLELVSWTRAHRPGLRCILITGYGCNAIRHRAEDLGLSGYFEKPLDLASLADGVCAALQDESPERRESPSFGSAAELPRALSSDSTCAQTDLVPQVAMTDGALGQ